MLSLKRAAMFYHVILINLSFYDYNSKAVHIEQTFLMILTWSIHKAFLFSLCTDLIGSKVKYQHSSSLRNEIENEWHDSSQAA